MLGFGGLRCLRRAKNEAAFEVETGRGRRPEGGPKKSEKCTFRTEKGLLRKASFRLGGSAVSVQNRFVPSGLYEAFYRRKTSKQIHAVG